MNLAYEKPRLKDLTVGSRIVFIRRLRNMTRKELAVKIGLSEENAKRLMSRYERSVRLPADDKLKRIAEILNVNIRMISEFDLDDPKDLYYLMLWQEELCPNFTLTRQAAVKPENETQRFISRKYYRWHEMKRKYRNHEITYREYWDWKLAREE